MIDYKKLLHYDKQTKQNNNCYFEKCEQNNCVLTQLVIVIKFDR